MQVWRNNGWQKPPHQPRLDYSHPFTDGLIACWPCSEGAGRTLYDLANGYGAAFTGSPTWGVGGFGGASLYCSSTSNYAAVTNAQLPIVGYTAFSLGAWIYRATNAQFVGVTKNNYIAGNRSFSLDGGNGAGRYGTNIWNTSDTSIQLQWTAPGGWVYSAWHHCVLTYNGTTESLYIDGVLRTSAAATGVIQTCTSAFQIGTGNLALNGAIEGVTLHSRALSAGEIADIYSSPWSYLLDPGYLRWMRFGAAGFSAVVGFVGASALSPAGNTLASGLSTMSGVASLAPAGNGLANGGATLSGVASLVPAGNALSSGVVALSGVATLSAVGNGRASAALNFSGAAQFVAVGSRLASASASVSLFGAANLALTAGVPASASFIIATRSAFGDPLVTRSAFADTFIRTGGKG